MTHPRIEIRFNEPGQPDVISKANLEVVELLMNFINLSLSMDLRAPNTAFGGEEYFLYIGQYAQDFGDPEHADDPMTGTHEGVLFSMFRRGDWLTYARAPDNDDAAFDALVAARLSKVFIANEPIGGGTGVCTKIGTSEYLGVNRYLGKDRAPALLAGVVAHRLLRVDQKTYEEHHDIAEATTSDFLQKLTQKDQA